MPESLFNQVAAVKACNFIKKETLLQVFSEFFENFKNTYFEEHLLTAASDTM